MPFNYVTVKTVVCDRCGLSQEYDVIYDLHYWKTVAKGRADTPERYDIKSVLCPTCVRDFEKFMTEKLS